jgi:hypothetical protein
MHLGLDLEAAEKAETPTGRLLAACGGHADAVPDPVLAAQMRAALDAGDTLAAGALFVELVQP